MLDVKEGKITKISRHLKSIIKCIRYPHLFKEMLKIINNNKNANNKITNKTIEKFDEFTMKELNVREFTYNSLKKISKTNLFHGFIAGSDQIWSPKKPFIKKEYYLRFAPKNKRIAYAPSFGVDIIPKYNKGIMKKYINDFNSISVREEEGRKILKDLLEKDIPVVLDPTLLIDKEDWISTINSKLLINEEYIFCYFLDEPSSIAVEYIKKYAKNNKVKIIYLMNNFNWNEICEAKFYEGDPLDFVRGIMGAKMVFTDSFHSVAFSLNLNVPFYVFKRNYGHKFDQSSRITSILRLVKEEKRFIMDNSRDINMEVIKDYSKINNILITERNISLTWLKDKLNSI